MSIWRGKSAFFIAHDTAYLAKHLAGHESFLCGIGFWKMGM